MSEKSDLHREYVLELENELRELEKREESATRRLQLLVYPAMVAFIILAAYGFYMVQSLTSDVARMAQAINTISSSVDDNMKIISNSTIEMSDKMTNLVHSTESMTGRMGNLVESTGQMTSSVGVMSHNVGIMRDATTNLAASTNNMQQDMWSLNQNISTPLSMFNKFVPWNNNSNGRFPGSRKYSRVPPPMYYPPYPVQTPIQQSQPSAVQQQPMDQPIPTAEGGQIAQQSVSQTPPVAEQTQVPAASHTEATTLPQQTLIQGQ